MPRLLIVAPDPDLRRSLSFALEAEGYDVVTRANIWSSDMPTAEFDCAVLDHHGADGGSTSAREFCRDYAPVIVLANSMPHRLTSFAFRTVLKPLLGEALSAAIQDALGGRVTTT